MRAWKTSRRTRPCQMGSVRASISTRAGAVMPSPRWGGRAPAVNPEVAMATDGGARNEVPSFVLANGPVREARFKFQPDGVTRDGGVHNLFVITGRFDAPPGCQIAQEDFEAEAARNNLIFR